jgi:hypothetical protein
MLKVLVREGLPLDMANQLRPLIGKRVRVSVRAGFMRIGKPVRYTGRLLSVGWRERYDWREFGKEYMLVLDQAVGPWLLVDVRNVIEAEVV